MGRCVGDLWGDVCETCGDMCGRCVGRRVGDVWEMCGRRVGDVWKMSHLVHSAPMASMSEVWIREGQRGDLSSSVSRVIAAVETAADLVAGAAQRERNRSSSILSCCEGRGRMEVGGGKRRWEEVRGGGRR